METKTCSKCHETKSISEFWRKRAGRAGLQAACKTCSEISHRATIARAPRFPAPDGMKRCAGCKEIKPIEEFCRNARYFDGRHHSCKKCHYAYHARYRVSEDGKEKIAVKRRAKFGNPKTKAEYYDQKMRKKFGLPPTWTYDQMLASQGGRCAICGIDHNPGMFRFAIDHDAATGLVRGLLCGKCNFGLGSFRDFPKILRRAATYIENPPGDGTKKSITDLPIDPWFTESSYGPH